MKFRFLGFLIFSSTLLVGQSIDKTNKALDKFIKEGIEKWQPPGLAVTVVKDGEIVFTKAYGVTNINTQEKVDTNTLFGCMSTTKAFVAAGLAMLVDDGKLNWQDKVIDYLPEFKLKDPYMTREINIVDLLTHRTGIGNTDYLWAQMNIPSDDILYKMREVDKTYSLRSSFIYQNIFYLAAGEVIEKITGKDWGEFLKERIYDPLGMVNTHATLGSIQHKDNKAEPHFTIDGKQIKVDNLVADDIGPAGSMWSSINDMGKWIQFLLNDGQFNGITLLSETNFKELFKTHQIVPSQSFYPTQQVTKPNFKTYGLGWFQHDYKGKMVQFHTGSLPGLVAIAGMIPEDEVGVYVMGNLDHVELRHAIMYAVFDLYSEGEMSRNWSEAFYPIYHSESSQPETPQPVANTSSSFEQKDMAGSYSNNKYGIIKVWEENGVLKYNMNDVAKGTLSHWHYNTYKVTFDIPYYGEPLINFRLDTSGKISHIDSGGELYYLTKE
jgi:CubicO group peptidase (beta-lactamase class C family)